MSDDPSISQSSSKQKSAKKTNSTQLTFHRRATVTFSCSNLESAESTWLSNFSCWHNCSIYKASSSSPRSSKQCTAKARTLGSIKRRSETSKSTVNTLIDNTQYGTHRVAEVPALGSAASKPRVNRTVPEHDLTYATAQT
jgi:hypothetical protein